MKSETNPKTVMLKDYIIDMDSVSAKVTIDYEVVLENNTDFIVKRRTLKTDRELVVLVSKGIFYIKDCKTDHVDQLTETNLSSFLRDLKERCITLHQVHWLHTVFRESVDFIMNVITDEKLMDMCRHNVLVSTHYPHWYVPFWEQNSKLFMRLYNMFPNMSDRKKYQPSIPVIFWIERHHGANEAMYFAEKLVQSGITELNFSSHYTNYYDNNAISSKEIVSFKAIMESPYNINLRRFIDYILFDLYAQGYSSVERTFFKEYMDYLQMQRIRKSDVTVAKNYLNETEMRSLNEIVTMYLDYAERQARRGNVMYMADWVKRLDAFLQFNEEDILHDKGKVTAAIAKAFAEKEFEKFRVLQDRTYQSDFDRLVAETSDDLTE